MSETGNANPNEKAAKIRRKPEHESVLRPTFAATRSNTTTSEASASEDRDDKFLQHQPQTAVSSTSDTILLTQATESPPAPRSSLTQNFTKIPLHSSASPIKQVVQAQGLEPEADQAFEHESDQTGSQAILKVSASSFGWGDSYRPVQKAGPSWGKSTGSLSGVIQRDVTTDFGDFVEKSYTTIKTTKGKEIGVELYLQFKPGPKVDADLIGMVQGVSSINKGKPLYVGNTAKERKIVKGRSLQGGADEGFHIDQAVYNRNPLYAVENAPNTDTKLSQGPTPSPVKALTPKQIANLKATQQITGQNFQGWGGHGFRFKDKAGVWKTKDAELHDTPMLPGRGKNASQMFETTALAIDGNQKDTYYGSVQWGWKTDDQGKFTQLPLTLKSAGVPSSTFMESAELWNKSKTSKGKETLDLPIVKVMKLYSNPLDAMIDLGGWVGVPQGTKIRVLDNSDPLVAQVEVTEGPYKGQKGYTTTDIIPAEQRK